MKRRILLKSMAGLASSPLISTSTMPAQGLRNDNPIVRENRRPGTVEWQLQYHRFDDPRTLASYPLNRRLRSSAIEGYASKTSVLKGEPIDFMVSLDPPGRLLIDIYRMGYYGGAGGRHMVRMGPFKCEPQSVPMMTTERLRECRWERCTRLAIPKDWPSGVYLAKLTRDEPAGFQCQWQPKTAHFWQLKTAFWRDVAGGADVLAAQRAFRVGRRERSDRSPTRNAARSCGAGTHRAAPSRGGPAVLIVACGSCCRGC